MNRKAPTCVRALEVAPLGGVQYIGVANHNMSQVYHIPSPILQVSPQRVQTTAGLLRGIEYIIQAMSAPTDILALGTQCGDYRGRLSTQEYIDPRGKGARYA